MFLVLCSCTIYNEEHFDIDGVDAQVLTPKVFPDSGKANLLIYIHGNGENYLHRPEKDVLKHLIKNNYSYACITIQDESMPPFTNSNSGWGNEEAYNRVVALYKYLMNRYPFNENVVLAGGSMGGLTLGQILVRSDIPLKAAIGIGPVPSLRTIWANAPERRPAIRNAHNINIDGLQDDLMDSVFNYSDPHELLINANKKLPSYYLYYGEDDVFHRDFGGLNSYMDLKAVLERKGSNVIVRSMGVIGHANKKLYKFAITDEIFINK